MCRVRLLILPLWRRGGALKQGGTGSCPLSTVPAGSRSGRGNGAAQSWDLKNAVAVTSRCF